MKWENGFLLNQATSFAFFSPCESNRTEHFAIKTLIHSICGWMCKPRLGFPKKLLFAYEIYVYSTCFS